MNQQPPQELAVVLRALADAGIPQTVQAKAFRVSAMTLANWRARFGVVTEFKAITNLEGEEWRDRADLGVRVSSLGRVASIKTNVLLRITTPPTTRIGAPYVTVKTGTPGQTTKRVARLVAETFGFTPPVNTHAPWTDEDVATLRESKTFPEAYATLPHRSPGSIKMHARKIGVNLKRVLKPRAVKTPAREDRWAPVRGSVPMLEPLWMEAAAVVPVGMPVDVREDLISDLVVMALEGFEGTMAQALKLAKTRRNAMFGAFKERSAFDIVPGTDNLRLIDTFVQGDSL